MRKALWKLLFRLRSRVASFGSGRECNLCGWQGRQFLTAGQGVKRRPDALCPRCRSVERHRLAHVLLRETITTGQRTLHVAPEPSVTGWLRAVSTEYLSIDLDGRHAHRAMDLTRLELADATFSLVYCSHVLEHIPDDAAAIREMRRVLQPGGLAVVQVPVRGEVTDEDLRITDPEERERRFDQRDHVRVYGLDIAGRLASGGFAVEILEDDLLEPAVVKRHGLTYATTRQVFLCRVPG
jgi:SAM-dependent methyltransferase